VLFAAFTGKAAQVLRSRGASNAKTIHSLIYRPRGEEDKENGPGTIRIEPPFDGKPATSGNGMMPAFRTKTRSEVRTAHAAGIANGGTDEGPPGPRPHYGEHFYAGYMRDPAGNKLAVFCMAERE
jgi:hypothetical protein